MTDVNAKAEAQSKRMFELHVGQLGFLVDGAGSAMDVAVVDRLIDEARDLAERIPASDEAGKTLVQLKIKVLEKGEPDRGRLRKHVEGLGNLVAAAATVKELASVERMIDDASEYAREKTPGDYDVRDALDRLKARCVIRREQMGVLKGTVKPPAAKGPKKGPKKGRVN